MPQRKRGKPRRSKKRKAHKRLDAMRSHVLAMEEPLRETGNLVRALCLMGDGLHYTGDEDEARAVSAVAWTTLRRANALQEEWNRLVEAGTTPPPSSSGLSRGSNHSSDSSDQRHRD